MFLHIKEKFYTSEDFYHRLLKQFDFQLRDVTSQTITSQHTKTSYNTRKEGNLINMMGYRVKKNNTEENALLVYQEKTYFSSPVPSVIMLRTPPQSDGCMNIEGKKLKGVY